MSEMAELHEVRKRREALLNAVASLEASLSAPASGSGWPARLGDALSTLRTTLDEHVVATEASDGILNQVRMDAPRLSNHADRLAAEHVTLMEHTEQLIDRVDRAPAEWTKGEIDNVRDLALDLLAAVVRHRQRGADLIYDAYHVDVGGTG